MPPSRPRPLNVVMAPDSLKGSLSATAAAAALAEGFLGARPGSTIQLVPMSDGGEGLVEILQHAVGGEFRTARVADALGRPVLARYLVLPDGVAVMESAEAIGLTRLTCGTRCWGSAARPPSSGRRRAPGRGTYRCWNGDWRVWDLPRR